MLEQIEHFLSVDLHSLLSPVMTSAVTWLVAAGLAGIAKIVHGLKDRFKKIEVKTDTTQKAIKILMRSELIRRYQHCRDHGNYMYDKMKDEWLSDYETYKELEGVNGYLDAIHQSVINMPCGPEDQKGEGTD